MATTLDPASYAFLTQAQKDVARNQPTPEPEISFTDNTINALSQSGIREGDMIGNSRLDPSGVLKPVSIVSSDDGLKAVTDAQKTAANLSPLPQPETPKEQPKSEQLASATTKVTLINPNTEQEVTFDDAAINRGNIEGFLSQGYQLASASGQVPDWLSGGTLKPKSSSETALETLASEIKGLKTKLNNFDVSNDPALQRELSAITGVWDSRIADMQRINKSREAALTTTGIRLGSQFTGGVRGGVMGSIITEEERQGVDRISDLEAKKQAALAEAKSAYAKEQWDRYVDLVDMAEKSYENQLSALKEINKAQAEQDKKIQDALRQSTVDTAIAGLLSQGVTDPLQLIDYLNFDEKGNRVGDVTSKEIADAVKNLIPEAKNKSEFDIGVEGRLFEWARQNPELSGLPEGSTLMDFWQMKESITNPKSKTSSTQGYGGGQQNNVSDFMFVLTALPTRMKDSDTEKELFREYFNDATTRGLTPYEMVDELTGYKVTKKTAFSEGMRRHALAQDMEQQQIAALARLINAGANEQAIQLVENAGYEKIRQQFGESFVAEADVTYVHDKVKEIEDLLGDDWVNSVGAFSGSFNKWISKKFGVFKANDIRAKLTSLTADLINKRAGSALTDQEWERLVSGSVPEFNEAAGTWRTKLSELKNNPLQRLNAERQQIALPTLDERTLKDRKLRIPLYSDMTTVQTFGVEEVPFQGGESGGSNFVSPGGKTYNLPF